MSIRNSYLSLAVLATVLILAPCSAEADTPPLKTAEETVRDYFKEIPVMIDIARCESKFRQFNADGSVLRGGRGGGMVGVFQLYDSIHRSTATALGFDIATLEGNLAYAKHLYIQSGTAPWNSAKACWKTIQSPVVKPQLSDAEIAALQARIKVLKKILTELQELLEKKKVAMRH